jgi:outer membrane biosynthesis protein TonB
MPDGLTLRTTVVLVAVAVAFGLAFAVQSVPFSSRAGDGTRARSSFTGDVARAGGPQFDVRLTAAERMPALREPRAAPKRKASRRPVAPAVPSIVTPAPSPLPLPVEPTATISPVPTPAPHLPPPPARTPQPTPVPTAAPPPSGHFDTTGE